MARKGRLARVWLAMLVVCSLVAAPLTAMAAGEVAENVNTIGITKDTTQEQLDAWAEGAAVISGTTGQSRTITLQKDIVLAKGKNINFGEFDYSGGGQGAAQPYLTLDLNGHSITGKSIVVANLGNLVIQDSKGGGRIVYDDPSGYMGAVNNAGYNLIIKGGTIVCNGAGASAYNCAVSAAQNTNTVIEGGTLDGGKAGAVVGYGGIVIKGGTLKGAYGAVAKVGGSGGTGEISFPAGSTAKVVATKAALYRIEKGEAAGRCEVSGGTFDAPQVVKENTDVVASTTQVSGGAFTADPSAYVETQPVAEITPQGGEASYVVGEKEIRQAAKNSEKGDEVTILSGDVEISGLADGVVVSNQGSGTVTANGETIKQEPVEVCTHVWGEPVWTWAEDGSSAQAVFACTKDKTHTKAVKAEVSSETVAATCAKEGQTVYTASVTLEGKTYTDTKTVVLPATGAHSYEMGVCTVCGAKLENTATETPASPAKTPQTGDESQGMLWLLLAALSGLGLAGTVGYRVKANSDK